MERAIRGLCVLSCMSHVDWRRLCTCDSCNVFIDSRSSIVGEAALAQNEARISRAQVVKVFASMKSESTRGYEGPGA